MTAPLPPGLLQVWARGWAASRGKALLEPRDGVVAVEMYDRHRDVEFVTDQADAALDIADELRERPRTWLTLVGPSDIAVPTGWRIELADEWAMTVDLADSPELAGRTGDLADTVGDDVSGDGMVGSEVGGAGVAEERVEVRCRPMSEGVFLAEVVAGSRDSGAASPGGTASPGSAASPGSTASPGSVATGAMAVIDDVAVFDRIVTEPDHRRRGHGRKVMAALTAAARDAGARRGLLFASVEGQRLYTALGWTAVAPLVTYATEVPSPPVRERMRAALTRAMKARDQHAVRTLRIAMAAIDNAEAVPLDADDPSHRVGALEATAIGVGAAEVARRELSQEQVRAIIAAEIAEDPQAEVVLAPFLG